MGETLGREAVGLADRCLGGPKWLRCAAGGALGVQTARSRSWAIAEEGCVWCVALDRASSDEPPC